MKCLKCGYRWTERISLPRQCPLCKRYDYLKNKKIKKLRTKSYLSKMKREIKKK